MGHLIPIPSRLSQVRVLAVGAGPEFVAGLARRIREQGPDPRVSVRPNCEGLGRALCEERFDAALIGTELPVSEWNRVVGTIKDHEPGLPVILMSTPRADRVEAALAALDHGVDSYVLSEPLGTRQAASAILGALARLRGMARLRSLLAAVPDLLFRVGADGTYLDVHAPEPSRLFAPLDGLVGTKVTDVLPQRVAARSMGAIESALDSGAPQLLQYALPMADGLRHFEARCVPSGGREVLVMVREVTEQKAAERHLGDRETRLRLITEQVPAVIWTTDWRLVFTSCMGTGLAGLGFEQDELAGTSVHDFFEGAGDPEEALSAHYDALEGRTARFRANLDGRHFIGLVEPLRDETGDIAGAIGAAVDVTARRQAQEEVERSWIEIRNLAESLHASREDERAAVAREVHDELGQNLTLLRFGLTELADDLDDEKATARVEGLFGLIDNTIGAMRALTQRLRPPVLDSVGLLPAVEWQAQDVAERGGLELALELPRELPPLSTDRATAVFRILQEALTNVVRHADARRVAVSVACARGELELVVRDDGRGIDPGAAVSARSVGLIGMRERARSFDGRVEVDAAPGGGTRVCLTIPADEARRA